MLRQPEKQILPAHGLHASRRGAGQRFRLRDIAPALVRCMGFRRIEFALLVFRLPIGLNPCQSLMQPETAFDKICRLGIDARQTLTYLSCNTLQT